MGHALGQAARKDLGSLKGREVAEERLHALLTLAVSIMVGGFMSYKSRN